MKKYTHEKAHEEIDYIFKTLLPQRGMAERPEQTLSIIHISKHTRQAEKT